MNRWDLIAFAIAVGGWALGLVCLVLALVAWYFGWDVRAKRLARRLRARAGGPRFERSASWWVERHAARPARHRARGAWLDPAGRARAVRTAVVRRARRVVVGVAALVDELTAPTRQVTA